MIVIVIEIVVIAVAMLGDNDQWQQMTRKLKTAAPLSIQLTIISQLETINFTNSQIHKLGF